MYWKKESGIFKEAELLNFASEKGWKLVDTKIVDSSIIDKWVSKNQPIFPLDHSGLHPSSNVDNIYNSLFLRWIKGTSKLYKFDSGWVVIDNDKSKTAYGYVLLSQDQKQMSVYHLWGE
jgi:hypothetical protein